MRRLGIISALILAILVLGAVGARGSAHAQQPPDTKTVIERYK